MRPSPSVVATTALLSVVPGCRLISDASVEALFGATDPAIGEDSGDATTDTDTDTDTDTEESGDPPDDSGSPIDADGDGHPVSTDCDDNDPARYPGADEVLDAIDNDCDGALVSAVRLDLPADPGSVGPVELFVRTDGGTPLVVLAWTSERCEDDSTEQRACMGRRFWTPGAEGEGASGFDPQSVSSLELGPSSAGTVLDFAYAEQGAVNFIRAVRTDATTTIAISRLDGDAVSTAPFPDTYGTAGTETFLALAEEVSLDLRILDTLLQPTSLGVACASGRLVDMTRYISNSYTTQSQDWLLESTSPRVDGCAISASLFDDTRPRLAVGMHYPDEDVASQYHAVGINTLMDSPIPQDEAALPGDSRHMDSSRVYVLDRDELTHWGVNATAHSAGLALHRYVDTTTGAWAPVQMDFTISSDGSGPMGLQHVGVDVINDSSAPAWVCLVDDDGAAYLGRAQHSADGLDPELTQYPVALDGLATTCAISAFQGTHVVAAFDTATGPHLVQAPLAAVDAPPSESQAAAATTPASQELGARAPEPVRPSQETTPPSTDRSG